MTTEHSGKIVDTVTAALVDCTPAPAAPKTETPRPVPADERPTDQARTASITQVGAQPPPR